MSDEFLRVSFKFCEGKSKFLCGTLGESYFKFGGG